MTNCTASDTGLINMFIQWIHRSLQNSMLSFHFFMVKSFTMIFFAWMKVLFCAHVIFFMHCMFNRRYIIDNALFIFNCIGTISIISLFLVLSVMYLIF